MSQNIIVDVTNSSAKGDNKEMPAVCEIVETRPNESTLEDETVPIGTVEKQDSDITMNVNNAENNGQSGYSSAFESALPSQKPEKIEVPADKVIKEE